MSNTFTRVNKTNEHLHDEAEYCPECGVELYRAERILGLCEECLATEFDEDYNEGIDEGVVTVGTPGEDAGTVYVSGDGLVNPAFADFFRVA